jgi:hypothetical protein
LLEASPYALKSGEQLVEASLKRSCEISIADIPKERGNVAFFIHRKHQAHNPSLSNNMELSKHMTEVSISG